VLPPPGQPQSPLIRSRRAGTLQPRQRASTQVSVEPQRGGQPRYLGVSRTLPGEPFFTPQFSPPVDELRTAELTVTPGYEDAPPLFHDSEYVAHRHDASVRCCALMKKRRGEKIPDMVTTLYAGRRVHPEAGQSAQRWQLTAHLEVKARASTVTSVRIRLVDGLGRAPIRETGARLRTAAGCVNTSSPVVTPPQQAVRDGRAEAG